MNTSLTHVPCGDEFSPDNAVEVSSVIVYLLFQVFSQSEINLLLVHSINAVFENLLFHELNKGKNNIESSQLDEMR